MSEEKKSTPYEQLRDYKFYKGKQEAKKISASQCGAPLLQLYLSQTCKVVDGPNSFSKATIGSIAHRGMEELIEGEHLEKEIAMERMLPNGWKITGTSDLIDHENKVVIDYKFEMNYAYRMHFKEGPDASYNMQGACYSWLCHDNDLSVSPHPINLDYEFHIMSFITDHSPIKKDHPAEAIQVTQMPIHDNYNFQEIMFHKTNELESHINTGVPPPECDDVWWRSVNGKKVRTRCEFYCKYKDVCPYVTTHSTQAANVASWG